MSEKKKSCLACAHSYMEPDSDLICGHKDSGAFGLNCHREPPAHCGANRSKFEQHPMRDADGIPISWSNLADKIK